ncbi:dihydrofolate reductase family protein [Aspergillus alliaceus]|uniref:dihydrofolate reductase family protein n=1 Tax=Petromyces alliaceus TaxID=209559 RepID=UPI0012A6C7D8|nr:dihydrofolate reductase-like domain-containing protein [Aspergillus alliaceus]KAB8228852.1 dihydrofolate reductase-like domain-containing protein [Aspergillus alliaceus]
MSSRTFKTRAFIATSIDGYIARHNDDVTWLTNPPKNIHHIPPTFPRTVDNVKEHMSRVDCMIMGRRTYEYCISLPEWPYSVKQTFVLSKTMAPGILVKNNVKVEVVGSTEAAGALFEREGVGLVYIDGGKVITDFLRKGWVDEMVITTTPVLIGAGVRLFGELGHDVRFTLVGVDTIEDGNVSIHYAAVRKGEE